MHLSWSIQLLGPLHAFQDGYTLSRFRTRQTALLLAYLAYHRDRAHHRLDLLDLLWPHAPTQAGRANLSVCLNWLRQRLEPPGFPRGSVLIATRETVRLDPDAVTTDVVALTVALQEAERAVGPRRRAERLAVRNWRG